MLDPAIDPRLDPLALPCPLPLSLPPADAGGGVFPLFSDLGSDVTELVDSVRSFFLEELGERFLGDNLGLSSWEKISKSTLM